MKRGDVLLVAMQGDFGKVRPAVVVQADRAESIDSATVCLVTSDLVEGTFIRVDVQPSAANGLVKASQVQADKLLTIRLSRVRDRIGSLSVTEMARLEVALALHLDLFAPQR